MRKLPTVAAAALLLSSAPLFAETAPPPAAPASAPAEPRPLPLPSPDGKPLAAVPGQRVFRIPLRFARVERFYRDQFGKDGKVVIQLDRKPDEKVLTLTSKRDSDAWAKATIREGAVDTIVEITPIVRFAAETIDGRGGPLVQFVLPANPHVLEQARSIDHMGSGPHR